MNGLKKLSLALFQKTIYLGFSAKFYLVLFFNIGKNTLERGGTFFGYGEIKIQFIFFFFFIFIIIHFFFFWNGIDE
jgi:hypothetical protein